MAPHGHKGRFWVYMHDSDGTLEDDFGEVDDFNQALDLVVVALGSRIDLTGMTIRIVDNQLNDGETIWLAGEGNRILSRSEAFAADH